MGHSSQPGADLSLARFAPVRPVKVHSPHPAEHNTEGFRGGLAADGRWLNSRNGFLVHVKPLSILFRAKFRDRLKQTDLFQLVAPQVWRKDWVVHSQPVGSGEAAFKYLAPYIFRVAISNRRILALEDGQVTFSYKDSATDQTRFSTISALDAETAPEAIIPFI